jgi:hypothetical protein
MEQDLMSTERVRAPVFVSQLRSGGPKLLCVPLWCKNQPRLHKYYLFFEQFLVILLQLGRRIVDSPSSLVVHFQP